MIRVSDIQREVAEHYDLPFEAMTERDCRGSRIHTRARPRQLGMYLATRLTKHSNVRIGHFFGGRDHSTVITGVRSAERRIRACLHLQEDARTLAKRLLFKEAGL